MTDLPYSFTIEKNGRKGEDYFASKSAAEKARESYEKRGFSVGEIKYEPGKASTGLI